MKNILWLFALFAFALPVSAATLNSVSDRAQVIHAQLQGHSNYHARLARKLADIAEDEVGQHDTTTAKSFITMAEEHAAQAGGAK